ncbi:MAG: CpaF family protein, partial [Methanobrevibacter sp.]|nr:CpaF family protein [Methanobrevibacter sp.]
MNNEEIIPQYDIVRQNYTPEEKVLLGEIRENLVDLAISSGENFQANEEGLLNDIRSFIFLRLKGENQDNYVSNEYLDRLSRKFLRDING